MVIEDVTEEGTRIKLNLLFRSKDFPNGKSEVISYSWFKSFAHLQYYSFEKLDVLV